MDDTLAWILFILFFFVIFLLIYYVFIYRRPSPFPATITDVGLFGFCDSSNICVSPLVCDNKQCKQPLNGTCTNIFECTGNAESCRDGKCSRLGTGDLDSECESICNTGLVCFNHICKVPPGFACAKSPDCITGYSCVQGICVVVANLGQKCLEGQCNTGLHCSNGYCQPTGIDTGQKGAYCGDNNGNPICDTTLTCVKNSCQNATQILSQVCDATKICIPPYDCISGACQEQVPCLVTGNCLNNSTCISGVCRGLSGQQCNSSNVCVVGSKCNLRDNTIVLFNNTDDIQGLQLPSISGDISRVRIDGDTNIIYAITTTGLYSITSSGSTWTKILNNPAPLSNYPLPPVSGKTVDPLTMQANIIDVLPFNGQLYVVLFDTTAFSSQVPQQYRVLDLTNTSNPYIMNNLMSNTTVDTSPTSVTYPYAGIQLSGDNNILSISKFTISPYNNWYVVDNLKNAYYKLSAPPNDIYIPLSSNTTDLAPYGGSNVSSSVFNVIINLDGVITAMGDLAGIIQSKNGNVISSYFNLSTPFSQSKIIMSDNQQLTYQNIAGIYYNTPYYSRNVAAGSNFYAIVVPGFCS